MNIKKIILAVALVVSSVISFGQSATNKFYPLWYPNVDITGSVTVGYNNVFNKPGTIRYNPSTLKFEFTDGLSWYSFSKVGESGETITELPWTSITGKPTEFNPITHTHSNYISTLTGNAEIIVAGTGNTRALTIGTIPYSKLSGTPTIFNGDYNSLTNKPTLFDGDYNNLSNLPSLFNGTWTSLAGKPTFATVATSGSYLDLTNKPSLFNGDYTNLSNIPPTFAPSTHTHPWTEVSSKPTTLSGYGITNGVSTAHPAAGITDLLIADWNTAVSWGDHALYGYQTELVSGSSIKTINGTSLLGSGNITITGSGGDVTGPASATTNNVVFFSSTTGKALKDNNISLTGTNTGDETNSTIKSKLGAASSTTDGYLTASKWLEFNSKLNKSPYKNFLDFEITSKIINEGGTVVGPGGSDSTFYTLPTVTGTTYYIDPEAASDGVGTELSPWKTIYQKPIQANCSYLFKRGTTYPLGNQIGIPVGPVILGAYGNPTLPRPVLYSTVNGNIHSVFFDNGYGMIRDIVIQKDSLDDINYYNGNNLRMEGCLGDMYVYNVHSIGGGVVSAVGEGSVYDNNWPVGTHLKILYSTIEDNWIDNLYVSSVLNVEVAHSIFKNCTAQRTVTALDQCDGDNVHIQGERVEYLIHHNLLQRNTAWGNKFNMIISGAGPNPNRPGWFDPENKVYYLKGDIYDNIFDGNNSPAVSGLWLSATPSPNVTNLYRNVFKNHTGTAVQSYARTVNAYYNIFYDIVSIGLNARTTSTEWPATTAGYYPSELNANNNIFYQTEGGIAISNAGVGTSRNNIFLNCNKAYVSALSTLTTADYNSYYGNTAIMGTSLAGTPTYTTLVNFRATGREEHGISNDPLLADIDAYNFRPLVGSPLLNNGIDVGLTADFDQAVVSDPPSIGVYENVDPPTGGEIIVIPPTIVYDSILTARNQIFGDYNSGDYVFVDSTGSITFHGGAKLNVNPRSIPVAADGDYWIQYGLKNLLQADTLFEYNPLTNTLAVDTASVTKVKFKDGTELLSASGLGTLPIGVTHMTKTTIDAGLETVGDFTPDIVFIKDTIRGSVSPYTIPIVEGYNPMAVNLQKLVSGGGFNVNITSAMDAENLGAGVASTTGNIAYLTSYFNQGDSLTLEFTGNDANGFVAIIKTEKSPFYNYVAPPVVPENPPFLDDKTTAWFAVDTASYYDLSTTNILRLFDKVGRKALGPELLDPINFQSGWTASLATPLSATTFSTSGGGGMYRNLGLNTRGVYNFDIRATFGSGTLRIYNAISNVGTPNMIIQGSDNSQTINFNGLNDNIYYRYSSASTVNIEILEASLKRYTGNHLVRGTPGLIATVDDYPDLISGSISFDGVNDYMQTALDSTLSYQKVFIVGQKETNGYYLYESLTGFGEVSGGVLTLGANASLGAFYDVDIKEIIFRDENSPTNEASFRNFLKDKYSVTSYN